MRQAEGRWRKVTMNPASTVPKHDIERLLQELTTSDNVQFRVDSSDGLFVAWLKGDRTPGPNCSPENWWATAAIDWHVMVKYGAIKQVRFVREPDSHFPERDSLSVRFVGATPGATLRADFLPLYDDRGQLRAPVFARWEELRERYGVGRDEVPVENGRLLALVGR
jgi:hypothetical protein